jgi:hypothetical protein
MHHRHRRFRDSWRGSPGLGHRWYERDNVIERLETYQRDLEQELADVSDLIRRLKEDEVTGAEPATSSV